MEKASSAYGPLVSLWNRRIRRVCAPVANVQPSPRLWVQRTGLGRSPSGSLRVLHIFRLRTMLALTHCTVDQPADSYESIHVDDWAKMNFTSRNQRSELTSSIRSNHPSVLHHAEPSQYQAMDHGPSLIPISIPQSRRNDEHLHSKHLISHLTNDK